MFHQGRAAKIMRILKPAERLTDALTDPARRERAMAAALFFYCAIWSLYGALAKGSQDVHFDMGEMVIWSREAGIGTPKHPPLAAWLVRVWFSVFPLADWAYYLFAMVLATFALWVAWRVSERHLDGEKRVAGVALLTFIPFFNFHALKFNANTVLVPLWALTTWCFLRSYETRKPGWAALAGLAAAAAMLGKYWSVFLLAGLGLAVIADPRRGAYFRSSAPWITIAVGALALGPHLVWIAANDFAPFSYAAAAHQATREGAVVSAIGFLAGVAGYIAAPVLLAALVARPALRAIGDTLRPPTPERRFMLVAFLGPLVLPALAAAVFKVQIVSLWAMGAMMLLPVVLLSSPLLSVSRGAAVRLLALAVAFPVAMTLAAPGIAIWQHRDGVPNHATHYRLLADEIEKAWRSATGRPLLYLGSTTNLVNGVSFYLSDRPKTLDIADPRNTPWAGAESIVRAGIALVCAEPDPICMHFLDARAGSAPRSTVTLSRKYLGAADAPVRYAITVIPPAN